MMRLWRLLKRLKFSRQPKYFEVKRMPVGLAGGKNGASCAPAGTRTSCPSEKPAIERGWKGDWLAMRRG